MCNYITWFHNDKSGYVIECPHCEKIQVGFGNVLLTLDADGFGKFREHVESYITRDQTEVDPHLKNIVLATPCKSIQLLLTKAELAGLHQMIEYVDNEMKTAQLLKLFEC